MISSFSFSSVSYSLQINVKRYSHLTWRLSGYPLRNLIYLIMNLMLVEIQSCDSPLGDNEDTITPSYTIKIILIYLPNKLFPNYF